VSVARELVDTASAPYRAAGRFAYHFARGKLRRDPVFQAILAQGLLARRAHILDLGCGQGLLASWLLAARRFSAPGAWPESWPSPPTPAGFRGIEVAARDVRRARIALGSHAEFTEGDVRRVEFGHVDCVIILDVLHYIEYADQRRVLERVHEALSADGVLLLRIGDAAGGFGFTLATWVDRMVLVARGLGWKRLHCRSMVEWRELLSTIGFDSRTLPMSEGTPFANVLIIAKPR
jgi:SAM-dependent methyltransferase